MRVRVGTIALLGLLAAPAALAHHSLAGQFDTTKSFSISGTVSRVDWMNPHVYVFVDVKDSKGAVSTYRLETLPVAMMRKAGLNKQMLLADGQTVNIQAHPARNGDPLLGYMLVLKLSDGREVQFSKVPGAEKIE